MDSTIRAEIDVQVEVENYLNSRRIFNFRPPGNGLPDVVVCYKGWFIGLEFKKEKTGKAQKHQKIVSKEIINSGGISAFPKSLNDVIKILEKVDKEEQWVR